MSLTDVLQYFPIILKIKGRIEPEAGWLKNQETKTKCLYKHHM